MADNAEEKRRIGDAAAGLVFIALGIAAFYMTNSMPVISKNTLGSAFWPRIVATILIILGGVLAAMGLAFKREKSYFHLDESKKKNAVDFFSVVGLLLAYGAVWNRVPFLVSTPIFIILVGRVMRMRLRASILLAAIMPAVLYVIFRIGLSVMIK